MSEREPTLEQFRRVLKERGVVAALEVAPFGYHSHLADGYYTFTVESGPLRGRKGISPNFDRAVALAVNPRLRDKVEESATEYIARVRRVVGMDEPAPAQEQEPDEAEGWPVPSEESLQEAADAERNTEQQPEPGEWTDWPAE